VEPEGDDVPEDVPEEVVPEVDVPDCVAPEEDPPAFDGFGDAPVPGETPPGGVLVTPPIPEPGVDPEGAIAGGGTPGWGDEPVPG
jgi:hypothetical protein